MVFNFATYYDQVEEDEMVVAAIVYFLPESRTQPRPNSPKHFGEILLNAAGSCLTEFSQVNLLNIILTSGPSLPLNLHLTWNDLNFMSNRLTRWPTNWQVWLIHSLNIHVPAGPPSRYEGSDRCCSICAESFVDNLISELLEISQRTKPENIFGQG